LVPERFTELCGVLIRSTVQGFFILSGVGANGGVDGEIGEWYSK
jgi:hypothetical protein